MEDQEAEELLQLLLEEALSPASLPRSPCTPTAASLLRPLAVAEVSGVTAHSFAADFERRFRGREPVVLRGLAAGWPAMVRWADAGWLAGRLGEHRVHVLTTKDARSRHFLKADCDVSQWPFADVVRQLFGSEPPADTTGWGGRVTALGGDSTGFTTSDCDKSGAHMAESAMAAACSTRLYARAPLSHGLHADVVLSELTGMLREQDRRSSTSIPAHEALGSKNPCESSATVAEEASG